MEWQIRQEDEEDEEGCCGLNDFGAALHHFIGGGRNLAMVDA
jgi:hypothetical protein